MKKNKIMCNVYHLQCEEYGKPSSSSRDMGQSKNEDRF